MLPKLLSNLLVVSLVVVSLTFASPAIAADAAPSDLAALQGDWKTVSIEIDGDALPKEVIDHIDLHLIIKDNTIEPARGGETDPDGAPDTFTLDSKAKTLHIVRKDQTNKEHAKGLYSLDGDNLKLCLTFGAGNKLAQYPKELQSDEEARLYTLKRVKPTK